MSFFIGCMLVLILYVVLGTISLYMFGSELHSTILWNIGHECVETKARCPTQSYVLRIMFLVVIVCHIPFIFFSGKEAMLIIIDEIQRKSISMALTVKLEFLNKVQNM